MEPRNSLDIFATAPPGLEPFLQSEMEALGFDGAKAIPGGVSFSGSWSDVWRANLCLRGAGRILVRLGEFRALHLAQLDKRARGLAWAEFIPPGTGLRIEATCRKSKIYHSGAAAERIGRAAADVAVADISAEAGLKLIVRIDQNICTVSIDTSGELLHKRGFKQAVGKAPLRETQAALLLRACGYDGREPVLDPMCGSGTIPIEAAEIASGLIPGRARSFAFEGLRSFDTAAFAKLKTEEERELHSPTISFCGYDRNPGAIEASHANAERAGVAAFITFRQQVVSGLERPEGPPGLVLVNPPYGTRIGEVRELRSLYQTLGRILMEKFSGWRVGIVTSDEGLARATGLPFAAPGPSFPHGALRVRLYRTAPLS